MCPQGNEYCENENCTCDPCTCTTKESLVGTGMDDSVPQQCSE